MVKREKRLKAGIESISEAIEEHKIRREEHLRKGEIETADYLGKEIESLKKRIANREEKIHRKD